MVGISLRSDASGIYVRAFAWVNAIPKSRLSKLAAAGFQAGSIRNATIPPLVSGERSAESNGGRQTGMHNVVIIGSGCAGLTAAIYAARANLKPLVIDGHEPGGQLALTTLVENFPGFPEGIQGPELIDNMRNQGQRFGAEFHTGHVISVDLSQKKEDL